MHGKPFASINFLKNPAKLRTVKLEFKTLWEAEVRGKKNHMQHDTKLEIAFAATLLVSWLKVIVVIK